MKSAKRGSERDQTHRRMTHGWGDAHKHLSQCRVRHHHECGQTRENVTCDGVLFTLSVGCCEHHTSHHPFFTVIHAHTFGSSLDPHSLHPCMCLIAAFCPSTSSSRMWWTNSLCTSANEDLGTFAEYDSVTGHVTLVVIFTLLTALITSPLKKTKM